MRNAKILLTGIVLMQAMVLYASPPDTSLTKFSILYRKAQSQQRINHDVIRMAFLSTFWDSTGTWKKNLSDHYYNYRDKPYKIFLDSLSSAIGENRKIVNMLILQSSISGSRNFSTGEFIDSVILNGTYSLTGEIERKYLSESNRRSGENKNDNNLADFKSLIFFLVGVLITFLVMRIFFRKKALKEDASFIGTGEEHKDAIVLADRIEELVVKRKNIHQEDLYTITQLEEVLLSLSDKKLKEKEAELQALKEDKEKVETEKNTIALQLQQLNSSKEGSEKIITDLTNQSEALADENKNLKKEMSEITDRLKKIDNKLFGNKSWLEFDKSTMLISYFVIKDLSLIASRQVESAMNIKELLNENETVQSPLHLDNYHENKKEIEFIRKLKKEGFTFPEQIKNFYFELRSVSKKSYNDLATD